jgi:hypothetical protein
MAKWMSVVGCVLVATTGAAAQPKEEQWVALRGALQAWTDLSFDAAYAVTYVRSVDNVLHVDNLLQHKASHTSMSSWIIGSGMRRVTCLRTCLPASR